MMPNDDHNRQEPTLYHYAALDTFSYNLHQYLKSGDITLIGEYELYKQPMIVDILIIKKNNDVKLGPADTSLENGYSLADAKKKMQLV